MPRLRCPDAFGCGAECEEYGAPPTPTSGRMSTYDPTQLEDYLFVHITCPPAGVRTQLQLYLGSMGGRATYDGWEG